MNRIIVLIVVVLFSTEAFAQSTNHVTHLSGSMDVAGTNVTVTQSGCVDILSSYCPSITTPYIIGYHSWSSSCCNGAYIFQFSPPIDSLTLNFSGVTKTPNHEEFIFLDLNGVHYPIPEAGVDNSCDSMAVLDANGNVAGCNECIESGWVGTTIYGPISEIIVNDSVVTGLPGGALFSLFISDVTVGLEENSSSKLQAFPNPFVDEFKVNAQSDGIVTMYDLSGNRVIETRIDNGFNSIATESLAPGSYIVKFLSDNGSLEFRKMIKE